MTKWAILEPTTKKVLSIVSSDTRPTNGVKGHDPSCRVGYIWNGWTFDAPKWTSLEFLMKFTKQERSLIRAKAKQDDDIADLEMLLTAAQEIVADHPIVVEGMDALVTKGVITLARRNELLGA